MPEAETQPDRLRDFGIAALLLLAAACNYAAVRDYVFEDAYITFRYAANLAACHGFVFQPGERVLGTSTPLYTLLLAAFGALGADIPAAGKLVFCLSLSACAFFGWRLLARRGASLAGAIFALAVVCGAGGILPFAGMETALHLALIFLAFLLVGEPQPWSLGLVLGLICLNRYDGVMAAAAVLLVRFLASRRWPWREALGAGALFGGWLLFARVYFGSFLPNTYAAKAADVSFFEYLLASLGQQARLLFLPLHWIAPVTARPLFLYSALTVLFLPLLWQIGKFLAGLPRRRDLPAPGLFAAALFALFLWLGYSWIGPPLAHHWYLIPATLSLLLVALAAWGLLPLPGSAARWSVLALILFGALFLPWLKTSQKAAMSTVAFGSDRIRAYADFAGWSRHHELTDTTVLTLEPGYLTYLSGQRAIDAAGLVTPGIFFHGPQARRDDFWTLLEKFLPKMAVLSSPQPREKAAAAGYLPVLTPLPGRDLWMRRDFYRDVFPWLYEAWQNGDYGAISEPAWRHPLAADFGGPEAPPFSLRRSRRQKVRGLSLDGQPYRQPVLTSRGAAGEAAAWSEPFLVDFDQLEFLFAASHGTATVAQLHIEGLLAWEKGGNDSPEGPEAIAPLEKIVLPVSAWRGKQAMLAFVAADARKHFFAADRIRSRRWTRQRVFDDFEYGRYDPKVWAETFGAESTDNHELAALGGLPMAQGRRAASSLFEEGPQRMSSRPFLLEHRFLSFSVFDFGDPRTTIALELDGRTVSTYSGSGSGKIALVRWDLADLQGKMAVLIVRDEAPEADIGIGIDSFFLYDE